MTKYGRHLAAAKRDMKKWFGEVCVITASTNPDGCHIYDAGKYQAFNWYLIKQDMLRYNLAAAVRFHHRKIDKLNPEEKMKYILVACEPKHYTRLLGWFAVLEVLAGNFRDENGGQIKWKHVS